MNFPLITWSATVGPIEVDGTTPPLPFVNTQTRYGFGIELPKAFTKGKFTVASS